METAASLVREGNAALDGAGIAAAGQDAELLLAHLLVVDRACLHAHPETPVAANVADRYRQLIDDRARRVPLQYLTGVQEFWSLAFRVTPAVLIPRGETELLVETLLALNRCPDPCVVDVGTGSGCIAIATAREIAGARVHAIDCSDAALEVARGNAASHGVDGSIGFHLGDLFEPLSALRLQGEVDFILCNPPYIGSDDLPGVQPEVRDHEPRVALTPGRDPLAVHRRLASGAARFLRPGGYMLVELSVMQEGAVRALYRPETGLQVCDVKADLAGVPRVLVARAGIPATRK